MQSPPFQSVSVACGGHYGHEVIVALDYDHFVWQLKDGKWQKLDQAWEQESNSPPEEDDPLV